MKKSLRYAGVVILMLAFFATCELLAILHGGPRDEFEFLSGSTLIESDLSGEIQTPSGARPAQEYRIYALPSDFSDVRESAAKELAKKGYVAENPNQYNSFWKHSSDRSVKFIAGDATPYDFHVENPYRDKSSWTIVMCANLAPENWSIPIKLAFSNRLN